MTLSPTEQQQVESAANKFASRSVSMGEGTQYLGECNTIVGDKYKGFEAGIEYALQNLLPARAQGFVEWCANNRIYMDTQRVQWWQKKDNYSVLFAHTTADLYQKYQEYLKQQQDGRTSQEGI